LVFRKRAVSWIASFNKKRNGTLQKRRRKPPKGLSSFE